MAIALFVGQGLIGTTTASAATHSRTTTSTGISGGFTATATVNASGMTQAQIQSLVHGTRLLNYFPSGGVSQAMWANWYPGVIYNDMAKIQAMGANTVRLFIYPQEFGYPTPNPTFVSELQQAVNMASAHGLKVVLSLFTSFSSYSDIAGSEQFAQSILAPYRGNPEVSYVELQNEIDPTNAAAISWANTMIPIVRADAARPVSQSVTGWDSALNLIYLVNSLTNKPDIYDYHFYGPPTDALGIFKTLEQWVGGTPLIIGETGYSTNATNTSITGVTQTVAAQESYQAYFFQTVENAARSLGLPPAAPWVLQDFQPTQYVNANEQHFGLLRLDGSAKPAASVVQSDFQLAASGRW